MINKIQKILEKIKIPGKTSNDFKTHLFNNFFSDVDKSFSGEEHISFITDFCFESLLSHKNIQNFSTSSRKLNNEIVAYCIVMTDRPFIVDSVLGWVKSESLYPSVFIHPNFFFNHKTKSSSYTSGEGYQRYSILYFEISDFLTNTQEHDLVEVLGEVHVATEDYSAMKKLLTQLLNKDHITSDVRDFIKWLCSDAFVMLGTVSDNTPMGICKIDKYTKYNVSDLDKISDDVVIAKSLMASSVHRRDPLDIITIKDGSAFIRLYGIFTTHSYRYKLLDIPIVKNKVQEITKHADFHNINYNRKELFSFLENLPREELFSASTDFLLDVSIRYIDAMTKGRTFVYTRRSPAFPLLTVAVFAPSAKFTMSLFNKITKIVHEFFAKTNVIRVFSNTQSINKVVMSFFIETDVEKLSSHQINELDTQIINICENSEDSLIEELRKYPDLQPSKIMRKYEGSLSPGYIAKHHSQEIAKDILHFEQISSKRPCIVSVVSHVGNDIVLKIYSSVQRNLHNIVSVLEQCGIIVFSENPFEITNEKISLYVHDIVGILKVSTDTNLAVNNEFTHLLEQVLLGLAPSTTLNKLVITSQIGIRDISLVRTFVKYLNQIQFQHQEEIVHHTLAQNPKVLNKILELFYIKFDPSFQGNRSTSTAQIDSDILNLYEQIFDITQDAVVKQIYKLVCGIVRTNFFLNKEYIAIKIDCTAVPNLPKPVPFREIFVSSLDFEALHLRFGKVARGGLRWSDRPSDFRTEILGLVKAQNTKNAVIVPVGSKGGFVLTKDVSSVNRDEYIVFGKECYKKFLSGCLDVCDNISDGEVITPQNIIKWEDEDPYFVVAADKGTATFSDIANSISEQYNFWLGDAFASGGSYGYDHKKMGITAKGAWIAVRRHMMEVGIDIQTEDFSVVGIGDMSGDVFGNGMLLSKHICLIAAFNHLHIFVDPSPDTEKSFAERERLFNLPRSTWIDYNKEVMSQGGMIYERSAKTCKLTPNIKERFGISKDEVPPNELIVYILKAQYDLLWNGGIGTYIKASNEKHAEVGDKANNAIRVDGKDLCCRMIGEGGNLGTTQRGRIEFAQNGGKVNTDAMDNSAGVNCSDVEVNIKIILNKLVDDKKLSLEKRNVLLEEMTQEVERLVLRNNYLQTQAITLISYNQSSKIDSQELLMKKLEVHANLDRENEFIPLTEEVHQRKLQKKYLTRPELCVLFAYSKIYLYQELLRSSLIEEKYFENDLLTYFPKQMQENFKEDILNHKLSKEIIATSVNNSVINRLGITFMSDIIEELQCKTCDIVRAYIVIREVFDLRKLWYEVESLDFKVQTDVQTQIFYDINQFIYKCIRFLLNKNSDALPITDIIKSMKPRVSTLINCVGKMSEEESVNHSIKHFIKNGVDDDIAVNIVITIEAMQMFQLAFESSDDLMRYVTVYYNAMHDIPVKKISTWVKSIVIENSLHKLALHELEEKFDTKYANLISRISTCGGSADECIIQWRNLKQKQITRFEKLINEVEAFEKQDISIISMVVDKFDTI